MSAHPDDLAAAEAEIERQRTLIDMYLPTIITGLTEVVYQQAQKTRDELTPDEVGLRAALSAAHWLAKEFAHPAEGTVEPLYDLPSVIDLLKTRKDSTQRATVQALMDAAYDVQVGGITGLGNADSIPAIERIVQEWLEVRAARLAREQN